MTPRFAVTLLLVAIGLGGTASLLSAHSGGLDANGGHYNRRTGEYHVHRPGRASSTPRATQSPGIIGGSPGNGSTSFDSSLLSKVTSEQKVDALAAVLIRRGLITEAELVAELQRGR